MWTEKEHKASLKKIEAAKKRLEKMQADHKLLQKQRQISCGECHTVSNIGDMVFIQPHWYESPHGCMGGDMWHQCKDDGFAVCPHCKSELRLYKHPELLAQKYNFKEVVDRHKD